ncbi:MAG: phoK 3 [Cyanobacteria bacterium RYN_339]|nr:phoK 3 [Cyanobacteria bacterium RYN_339]
MLALRGLLVAATLLATPVADPGPAAEAEAAFLLAVKRTRGPRTGDLFTLPNPYNFVSELGYDDEDFSHIPGRGLLRQHGTYHSTSWRYDKRVPLVFYGPGRVPAGRRLAAPATHQDLPATYAWLMHTLPPRDCGGRVLREAFGAAAAPPRVILTIVIDQGGRTLLAAHPGAYPHVAALMAGGTDFSNAESTALETETVPGHVGIGTGSWPGKSGTAANDFYASGLGTKQYFFTAETAHSPFWIETPTLADAWLRETHNRAIVIGQSHADRAAIGMVGHGSAYVGNAKPIVVFYDTHSGHLETNPSYYALPPYLADLDSGAYMRKFTGGTGRWMEHDIANADAVRRSPVLVELEGDAFARMIDHEPIGQDDVCDLLYVSFKSSDAVGHHYGYESEEAGAVLTAIDRQVDRLVKAVQAKAGAAHTLVVLTADHGATPLPELSGGSRLRDTDLLARINQRFRSPQPGRPAAIYATTGQIWLDRQVLAALHVTTMQVAGFVRTIKVDGKPFYRLVVL